MIISMPKIHFIIPFFLEILHFKECFNFIVWQQFRKLYFGAILGLFSQIWTKLNFPGKKGLSVFRYFNYLPSCKKSKKTNDPFQREMPTWRTDGQTDRRRERQWWFYMTLCRTGLQKLFAYIIIRPTPPTP